MRGQFNCPARRQAAGLLGLLDVTDRRLDVLLHAALAHVGAVRAEVHKVRGRPALPAFFSGPLFRRAPPVPFPARFS